MLLEIEDLSYSIAGNKILNSINLGLEEGKVFGLVGESGCGKTTLARMICGMAKPETGRIKFKGEVLSDLKNEKEWYKYRKKIQLVFQDTFGSLNHRLQIGQIVGEGIKNFFPELNSSQIKDKVAQQLEEVGLPVSFMTKRPTELSGGQRQRIGIARAIAVEPELLILDEPVSALDVSIQAQILNLLKHIQEKNRLTMVFISHDLAVVKIICEEIMVMKKGELLEVSESDTIFNNPSHPYTRTLVDAIPPLGRSENWLLKKHRQSWEDL